jgi:hypothetical protein
MNKTHETYCNYNLINLLTKSGFNWIKYSVVHSLCDKDFHWEIPLHIAQKWLREVKNIDVVVSRAMQWKQFYYTIEHEENGTSKIDFMSLNEDLWWLKYEEALEAGINKALEIILEKGE